MKLIISICLALMFIGCAGQETPKERISVSSPPGGDGDSQQNNPPPLNLEEGVSSQAAITCSKAGVEDIVYIAKTYQTPQPCQHSRAGGKSCLCEVFSTHENFSGQNGVFLFATGDANWCEQAAIDQIINNQVVTLSYVDSGTVENKLVRAAHDASYTCNRS